MSKSAQIFNLTAPYKNQYQGAALRVLFVCTVGMLRSPTAAAVAYKEFGWNTRSCGVDEVALIPLSVNLIMWADHIVFMDSDSYKDALKAFAGVDYDEDIVAKGRILNIDDEYDYHEEWLCRLIVDRLRILDLKAVDRN